MVGGGVKTWGFPAITPRCSNNYGPRQFPEKFIPLMIARAMSGQPLPIYGDGRNARDWIHGGHHCRALDRILHRGTDSEAYHVGSECELRHIEVAYRILDALGRRRRLVQFVAEQRSDDLR